MNLIVQDVYIFRKDTLRVLRPKAAQENLDDHTKNVHPGKPKKFVSATSTDNRSMFSSTPKQSTSLACLSPTTSPMDIKCIFYSRVTNANQFVKHQM